jgi:hypothetical protein
MKAQRLPISQLDAGRCGIQRSGSKEEPKAGDSRGAECRVGLRPEVPYPWLLGTRCNKPMPRPAEINGRAMPLRPWTESVSN